LDFNAFHANFRTRDFATFVELFFTAHTCFSNFVMVDLNDGQFTNCSKYPLPTEDAVVVVPVVDVDCSNRRRVEAVEDCVLAVETTAFTWLEKSCEA